MERRSYSLMGVAMLLLLLATDVILAQSSPRSSSTIKSAIPELQCPADTDHAQLTQQVQQLSGVLDSESFTFEFPDHSCFNTIPLTGDEQEYTRLTFTVNQSGWYTFILGADFDAHMSLYQDEFNRNNPCRKTSGIVLQANGFTAGEELPDERLSFFLRSNQTYSIAVGNQEAGTFGNWTIFAYGDNGGLINEFPAVTPFVIEQPLLCDDAEVVRFATPQQWQVNADGSLDVSTTLEAFFGGDQAALDAFLLQLSYTGAPTGTSNCGPLIMSVSDSQMQMGDCGSTIITRTFAVTPTIDGDCPPETITCQQTISLRPPVISDILSAPLTFTIPCDEDYPGDGQAGGPDDNPSADLSGVPAIATINGVQPIQDTYCNLGATYSDETRIEVCEGFFRYRRNWTLIDWCDPGNTQIQQQIISIADEVGPVISGIPEVIQVSTNPFSCVATVAVTIPTVVDGNGCSSAAPTTYTVLAFGEAFFAGGNIIDGDIFQIPVGPHTIIYCAEDDCGNETCNQYDLLVTDNIVPAAVCLPNLTIPIGGGDTANGIEGIWRLFPEDLDDGSFDNCGPVSMQVRRNYWRFNTCDSNPNRWSPFGDQVDFYCCDQGTEITVELKVIDTENQESICSTTVTVEDSMVPFCYDPDDASFSCASPPEELPDDLEAAYVNDFAATSILMSDLFGVASGTDNCVVDTIVELMPLIQLNDCGAGTITRHFEAWQARLDADLSDGLQIDEVLRSTNDCSQVITVRSATDFEMAFPADTVVDCNMPEPSEVEISVFGCDLFGVNTSITASYPPVGDECYQLAVTYDVINWCQWDGEYAGFEIPRLTEEDGDSLATGYSVEAAERPILRMTTATGPDDENCDGILSPEEDESDDELDLQYFLTIDRNHPDEDGDSNLPDIRFDNVAGTLADCIPADGNGISNYGRFRYTQLVRVFDATELSVVVLNNGGPTDECPNLLAGQFGDDDGDCQEEVVITFSVSNSCELTSNANLAYANLLGASIDAFAVDTNENGEIDESEFISDGDALDAIQANPDGTFTFASLVPISTLSNDNIVHALSVSFEDACGNQASSIIEFEVVDCKAPAPICINGLTVTLQPQIDGTCVDTIHATDFVGFEISDCTGQGPDTFMGRPVITSYAIYLASEIESTPDFVPHPSDSLLILQEDSEETTVINIVAFDEEGNYASCETYVLVQFAIGCQEGEINPFCFAPNPTSFACGHEPDGLPDDLETAYNDDFAATSILMSDLFGAPSGSVVVDTLVELTPMIQLNSCGVGSITRFFEGWEALPDADLSDGLQADEVNPSINNCRQIISVRPGSGFEIAFPADADIDCSEDELPGVEIMTNGCDVLSVNSSIGTSYPPAANECYQLEIVHEVINWCHWDGEYEGFEILRETEEDGNMLATGFSVEPAERPILRMTSEIGPDDEDCNGMLSPTENEDEDALDLRLFLTIDRSHPGADGDSNLPDMVFDNVADTPAECIPADNMGLRNYGRFRYRQLIRVTSISDLAINTLDFGGPTASCPDLLAGQFGDDDGDCEEEVTVFFTLSQPCELILGNTTPYTSLLSATLDAYALDGNDDGEITADEFVPDEDVLSLVGDLGNGNFSFSGSFPICTLTGDNIIHALQVSFNDECGNQASTIIEFEVVDCSAPDPVCFNGLEVPLTPQGDGSCAATVHAQEFEASPIFDCTGQVPTTQQELLPVTTYAIYRADEVDNNPNFTPNLADSTLLISDDNLETFTVYIYAFDEEGNYDFCETIIQPQQEAECLGSISGRITTRDAEPIKDVQVNISNEHLVTTAEDGTYSVGMLDRQQSYTIIPFLNSDFDNGVKTIDMIILLKHLLGIELMENPYQLIAADIDNDGAITDNDLEVLQQFILGNIDIFPTNTSWRFVDASYVFPVGNNPWFESFPEIISLGSLLVDATDVDFIGVKIGDLDDNAETNAQMENERTTDGTYLLYTDNVILEAGERYEIPIMAPTLDRLVGLQGTLQLDEAEMVDLDYGLATSSQIGLRHQDEGFITFAWNRYDNKKSAEYAKSTEPLFTLHIRSNRTVPLREVLRLNSRYTSAEAYILPVRNSDSPLLYGAGIRFDTGASNSKAFELMQNTPNPFQTETTIRFTLPKDDRVTLTIRDLSGRVMLVQEADYGSGTNSIILGRNDLAAHQLQSGVYTYTLQTATASQTRRMVLTN